MLTFESYPAARSVEALSGRACSLASGARFLSRLLLPLLRETFAHRARGSGVGPPLDALFITGAFGARV